MSDGPSSQRRTKTVEEMREAARKATEAGMESIKRWPKPEYKRKKVTRKVKPKK